MSWAYQLTDGWMCENLSRHGLEFGPDAPKRKWKPFQPEGTPAQYTRDRVVDIKHIRIEVKLDVPKKSIAGTTRLTVRPITDEARTLELDAVELNIAKVECPEAKIERFTNTGKKLIISFAEKLNPEKDLTFSVAYTATPRRGLYFVGPDKINPKKHPEVWSQGQDEDNRHWFPCFDYPNEKATSEVIATVPEKWFVLSNGALKSQKKNGDGTATFHWSHEVPHVSYLITLCAGDYVEVKGEWDGIPVNYYVPPGREADGERSFGKTPRMVEYYSKLIGVRYPYAKYAQITAADFIFGGMENTTATTQTDRTLHDAKAHLDFSSEPLVSHELVHNWFGDLLTCRDWSHGWLNESFATYFDNLWYRHELGESEFRYEMYGDLRAYLDEDGGRYRRPIVTNVYREPIDLFDRHLYQKGACVLNMLRVMLGDRLFFKAVKLYTERFYAKCVVTQDLVNAFEDATGRNFEWLFDQWIFKGGHPEFSVGCSYDAKHKSATLTVKQKQTPDELTSIFKLPVQIRFVGDGYNETKSFDLSEASHTFHFELPSRPKWIAFDPGNSIPKTLELTLDEDQLIQALKNDDDVMGRVYAAQALAGRGTLKCVEALGEALLSDDFWGVQAECAAALAKIHTPAAFHTLTMAVKIKHPKARRAVARSLGEWRNEDAADALVPLAKGDASWFVEATAAEALGKTRMESAFGLLADYAKRDSWLDVVRGGVFNGMLENDPTKALPVIEEWCRVGKSEFARNAALGLVGKAAREGGTRKDRTRVRQTLEKVLDEGFFLDRMAAMRSLRELRDREALGALTRFKDSALDARLTRQAEDVLDAIRSEGGAPPEVKALRGELDKLKEEALKMKEQLEKLAARGKDEPKKAAKAKPAKKAKGKAKKK